MGVCAYPHIFINSVSPPPSGDLGGLPCCILIVLLFFAVFGLFMVLASSLHYLAHMISQWHLFSSCVMRHWSTAKKASLFILGTPFLHPSCFLPHDAGFVTISPWCNVYPWDLPGRCCPCRPLGHYPIEGRERRTSCLLNSIAIRVSLLSCC